MNFSITGKHIEITDVIRKRAEEKTAKLPKYYDIINSIEVLIDGSAVSKVKGNKFKVEIIVRAEHSNVFVVTEYADDPLSCIDVAVHKLQEQLKRKKTKVRDSKVPKGFKKQ